MKTLSTITDVIIGLAIGVFLILVFIPVFLWNCVGFVRAKRTGRWTR